MLYKYYNIAHISVTIYSQHLYQLLIITTLYNIPSWRIMILHQLSQTQMLIQICITYQEHDNIVLMKIKGAVFL